MNDAVDPRNGRDSVRNTLIVALSVSFTCAVLVSATSVLLKPRQLENRLVYGSHRNIVRLLESLDTGFTIDEAMRALDVRIVDLATGAYVDDVDPETFDPRETLNDPESSVAIPPPQDIAGLKRRATRAAVYELRRGGSLRFVVLPVSGAGMWSTIYGYLALRADLDTIAGVSFYEHGETPGIGDRIEDPAWLARWRGRAAYADGKAAFEVVKPATAEAQAYQVDAITGATVTSESTGRMVRYWLGEHGFKPYLERLRREEVIE